MRKPGKNANCRSNAKSKRLPFVLSKKKSKPAS
jgi:hypothetical protein